MGKLKVLITGASGFVGGHLALGLARKNYQIFALANKNPFPDEVLKSASAVSQVDLISDDLLPIMKAYNPEIVIHAAALSKAEDCEKNPDFARQSNEIATERLLSCFNQVRNPRSRFIYISTDLVFDGNKNCPIGGFKEDDDPLPVSVYARSKRAGEKIVLSLPGDNVVTRICLVYGDPIGNTQGFFGWLKDGLAINEAVRLFEDEFRTPVAINDLVEAMDSLIGTDAVRFQQEDQRIFHFAGLERISRVEFGQKLCDAFGFNQQNIVRAKRADAKTLAPRPADVSLNSEHTCAVIGRVFKGIDDNLARLRPQFLA